MTRTLPSAMALGFILAASAAGSAVAAPTTLDTSFGTDGYAFSSFGKHGFSDSGPLTTVGPTGDLASVYVGNLFFDEWTVAIVQHDANGQPLDQDVFADVGNDIFVTDVRELADGRVLAVGGYGEGGRAWLRVVNADGSPSAAYDELEAPGDCTGFGDAVIHPSGQIVIAWTGCSGSMIETYEPDDFLAPVEDRAAREASNVVFVAGDVYDLALAPDGRVGVLADQVYETRAELPEPAERRVGFVKIGDGTAMLDGTWGDDGWADAISSTRLAIDDKGRPVVADERSSAPGRVVAQQESIAVGRLGLDGEADPSFDGDGVATIQNDLVHELDGLATDHQNRVIVSTNAQSRSRVVGDEVALFRLREDGTPDPDFGTNGLMTFGTDEDAKRGIGAIGDATAVPGGLVATFGFDEHISKRAIEVDPGGDDSALALIRLLDPKPPATQQQQQQQQQQQGTQPQGQPAPAPVRTTAASTSARRTAKRCLSRRAFTIRLRPRQLKSATVLVAGKKTKVTRRNGRLTARVDLRKLQQATFDVAVRGRTAKGKVVSETRTYRTCRVGERGRKVKGGSITISLG